MKIKFFFGIIILFHFNYSFSQFKATIISDDGKEYSGFIFEPDYYDIEHREPEDMYKIFLHDGKRKRKSGFVKFDPTTIKHLFLYNKKEQKLEFVFVRPSKKKFESTRRIYHRYHEPKEKSEQIKFENAWIPMILVKSGNDLDLLSDFIYLDFEISKDDGTFTTDFYNIYYVRNKKSNAYSELGFISRYNKMPMPIILGGNNRNFERNAREIFSNYCPEMISDIQSSKFIFGNKILKIFDYYLQNCN